MPHELPANYSCLFDTTFISTVRDRAYCDSRLREQGYILVTNARRRAVGSSKMSQIPRIPVRTNEWFGFLENTGLPYADIHVNVIRISERS